MWCLPLSDHFEATTSIVHHSSGFGFLKQQSGPSGAAGGRISAHWLGSYRKAMVSVIKQQLEHTKFDDGELHEVAGACVHQPFSAAPAGEAAVQAPNGALCHGPVSRVDLDACSLLLLAHLKHTAAPIDGQPAVRPHSGAAVVQGLTAFYSWQKASPLGRPCWLQTSTLHSTCQKALLLGCLRLQLAFCPLFCVHGLECTELCRFQNCLRGGSQPAHKGFHLFSVVAHLLHLFCSVFLLPKPQLAPLSADCPPPSFPPTLSTPAFTALACMN